MREKEMKREREKRRGWETEVGIPWHVVALVRSTYESKTHEAEWRSDEEGWLEYTAEGFSLQGVSREVKGGGAVRYAMCEITIAHP